MDGNAIFGFAGVIVGAAATYVGQRGAERRAERGEVKVAVRVLQTDLLLAMGQMAGAAEEKVWWTAVEEKITFPNWDRYEVVLARSLRFEQWSLVRNAIVSANAMQERSRWNSETMETTDMEDGDIENAQDSIAGLNAATDLLIELAERHRGKRERIRGFYDSALEAWKRAGKRVG